MKVFAVVAGNIDRPPQGYKGSWVYRDFFHGECAPVVLRYGERPYKPIRLIRNVRLMPAAFFPTIYLAVNPALRDQLAAFPHVDFAPCTWHQVYNWPVDEQGVRDLETRFSILTEDFGEWLQTQLEEPAESLRRVEYFGVVVPLLNKVASRFTCRPQFELPHLIGQRLPPVATCTAVHREYPLIKMDRYYIFSEPVFRVLEPHVSNPYQFRVYEREVAE